MPKFKVDKSKLKRQKGLKKSWWDNGGKGTVEAATGFGKTYVAVLIIKMLRALGYKGQILVCVPSEILKNDWRETLRENAILNFRVEIINTLAKEDGLEADLLILDEIHGYTGGEVWSTIFERVNYEFILGLTAKERDKEEDKAIIRKYAPIIGRVPMSECLSKGWVAPFIVYNLGLSLPLQDRRKYRSMHKEFKKYFSTFNFKLNLMYACLNNEEFRIKFAKNRNWSPKMVVSHAAQANRIMNERKQFLYTHDAIFEASKKVIATFPDRRIITFSEVTSFADKLGDAVPNSVVYHSSLSTQVREVIGRDEDDNYIYGDTIAVGKKQKKKGGGKKTVYVDVEEGKPYSWKGIKERHPDKKLTRYGENRLKDEAIKKFQSGEVKRIHTATALNEGVDIHGIDMSIKNSFNSTDIDSLQRTGRAVRVDPNNPDKRAIEVNLYIRKTQSEKWLRDSQTETPNVHWIDSIDEIT